MMVLLLYDLPRNTVEERKAANKFQKRLVRLGFVMKQFSVYEREVRSISSVERLIEVIRKQLPEDGTITLYRLPKEVNNAQLQILGNGVVKLVRTGPKIIIV